MQDILDAVFRVAETSLDVFLRLEIMAPTLGATVGGTVSMVIHRLQSKKAKILPFLPSYKESVDHAHDSATQFFAAVHELTMCVTEAWNTKHSRLKNAGSVESNLRQHQLRIACDGVKAHGQEMMDGFADYQVLSDLMTTADSQLEAAWRYTSRDNYRTEFYTVTSTDSDGNTTVETRSQQVYENTDHWFTFDASEARRASQNIATLARKRPTAHLKTPNVQRMRVRVDNLSQADRMFLEKLYIHTIVEDVKATPTEADLVACVNQWLLGTRVDDDLHTFEQLMDRALSSSENALTTIQNSEPSYHYNTGSTSHSGPPGYQAAAQLRAGLQAASASWGSVSTMWEICSSAAEKLLKWAEDAKTTEPDKDYVRTAIRAYEAAFPDSTLDVDQLTTPGWTALIGVLLALVTGLLVVAVHPDGPLF